VARLHPEKGVAIFLEAVARVAPLVPTCHFPVVGDGPLRQDLEVRAAQLRLQERVHFLGFRPDARELVSLLDVLVVPSLSEGAPLVILEAMMAGVPVVASAIGGIPDLIRHDREGLQVPPNDPMALSQAILSLLQDPVHARRLGEAGRRRAASQFRYATMLQKIEAIYHVASRIPIAPVASLGRRRLSLYPRKQGGDGRSRHDAAGSEQANVR
jgi:glycosyltransferase involved in cell wall biosynthesis